MMNQNSHYQADAPNGQHTGNAPLPNQPDFQGQQQFQNQTGQAASGQAPPQDDGGAGMFNSDILAQLQQIQQFVAQSDLGGGSTNPEAQNDPSKQDGAASTAFGDGGVGGKTEQGAVSQHPGQHAQSNQMTQQQIVDQKSGNGGDQFAMPGMMGQNFQSSMPGIGGLSGQGSSMGGAGGMDLLNQQQMLMALYGNQMPAMGGMGGLPMQQFNPMMNYNSSAPGGGGGGGGMGSAASFHAPAEKNQIKLFVGGLAFPTQESDMMNYFQVFGKVDNAIVMRDKITQRGRGFGFVLLTFSDEEEAQAAKGKILDKNRGGGHFVLDKRVDVKSADDNAGKGDGSRLGGGGHGGHHGPGSQYMVTNSGQTIQKPNPYVMVETKDGKDSGAGGHSSGANGQDGVKFSYPKSKIFVGGLDFKLTSEELKDHFMQFGDVQDAIILKDIFTGQSRGFGFVTFSAEDVAQHLIRNNPVTEINGRRVDIKKAEPKENGGGPPSSGGDRGGFRGGRGGGGGYGGGGRGGGEGHPATIAPYGQGGPGRDGGHHHSRGGHNRDGGDGGGGYQDRQRNYRDGGDDREQRGGYGGRGGGGYRGGGFQDRGGDRGHRGGDRGGYRGGRDDGGRGRGYGDRGGGGYGDRGGGRGGGGDQYQQHRRPDGGGRGYGDRGGGGGYGDRDGGRSGGGDRGSYQGGGMGRPQRGQSGGYGRRSRSRSQ